MNKISTLTAGSVIAATAVLGTASVALADGYAPARVAYERPADWSGVYFGVGSGYQWSSIDVVNPAAGFGITSDHDSALVTAHLGVQHQFGTIVVGIEGGWASTFVDRNGSSEACFNPVPVLLPGVPQTASCNARINDILTVGARAGWAAGKWMPYVTGGYANGAFDFAGRTAAPGALGAAGATVLLEEAHTRLGGWYIGGGVEWAVSPGWTTGVEYRHYEFDSGRTTAFTGCGGGVAGCPFANVGSPLENVRFSDSTDSITARVTWRWGRPEAAPLK
jgi:opacity protein-like surface antigen